MFLSFFRSFGLVLIGLAVARAAGSDEVAVVYNLNVAPDSAIVAEHYAARRGVPASRLIGLRLPAGDNFTRAEFRAQFQQPLFQELEKRDLIVFHAQIQPATENRPGGVTRVPVGARIRYLVLCYGVPLRVLEEPRPAGPGSAKALGPSERSEAAVDSELALLPMLDRNLAIQGPFRNVFYRLPNVADLNPTNGLLMVTRLDGPTSAVARSLVDQALAAETNGLWGRAFFDLRGLSSGGYKKGDDWIGEAAEVARRQGFETVVDKRPETFGPGFPMPQIALYAGWYDQTVSGPFTQPTVEFMPGAIAYHLFSFSARSLRTPSTWAGALLAKGATATVGYVSEPYLDFTVDVGELFSRLLNQGATFGEAVYAASPVISWQTTVVGDPLYRPFAPLPDRRPGELALRHSPLLAWVQLQAANLKLVQGAPPKDVAAALSRDPATRQSALLEEKLGDLHELDANLAQAIEAYRRALQLKPTPQQQIHLELGVARMLAALGRDADALDAYERFFRAHPKHPDLLACYRRALALAQKVQNDGLTRTCEAEIKRLTPPPPASAAGNGKK